MTRAELLVVLLAGVAFARPPTVPDFARMDELDSILLNLRHKYKEAEEFQRKPREERMILLFERSREDFEGKTLTGEYVVKELFEKWKVWRAKDKDTPAEAIRILMLLPDALKVRYATGYPIPKLARYKASVPLVKALTHKNLHIRTAAIECLEAVYGRTLFYRPDASPGARKKKQSEWKREIEGRKRQ
jgi:hypothetical protein